ncbi:hypothetical protein [Actinacidiphila yeochonensis]|uniref:hypothetical protein n=1 Tax=Actinacidiphila yeochonensis TaxID=89050 RepID=UPI0012FEBB4A|nr:hypothetical protein [Actinacidiphila yeochonensis]
MAATAVLAVALLGWRVYRYWHPTPPDVRSFARSATTQAADRAATATADSQVSAFRKATPWATDLGTSRVDLCGSESRTGSIGARPQWSRVSCQRVTTLYLAFDGDIGQRLRQLDAATGTLGWVPPPSQHRGPSDALVAALAYERQPPGDPDPAQSAEAAERPADIQVAYTLPARPDSSDGPRVVLGVAQKPRAPRTGFVGGISDLDGTSKRPHGNDQFDRTVYLTWKPLSPTALAAAGYGAHAFTLSLSITSTYATELPPATPPPAPTTGYYSPCYSGSHCG